MTKILITGKNSFIGRSIIKYSSFNQINEACLINKKPSEIDFINYEVVIHVAAIVHQSKEISEEEYTRVNTLLALEVAKYAKISGVRQFIFMSTAKVYGNQVQNDKSNYKEKSPCFPDDIYGISKLNAEKGLLEMETKEFTISIIRTPIVYGKGVQANMKSIINLVRKCPILPLANIDNKKSFTYVENLVGYIDRIIEKQASGIMIAKDDEWFSTTQLVETIAEHLGKKRLLLKCPNLCKGIWKLIAPNIFFRLHESFFLNNDLTNKQLDYKAPISTREGIKRTVNQN